MKNLLYLLTFLLTSSLAAQNYRSNVGLLHDNHARGRFLLSVYQLNQHTKAYMDSVLAADGFGSPAHTHALDSIAEVDSILTAQVDQYLLRFGFPNRENFSETLRITPWIILSHSRSEEVKSKHFDKFYAAYEDGDLEQRRLISFLQRQYRDRFQKDYQSYAIEDELLEELMEELGLKKSKGRFLKSFR